MYNNQQQSQHHLWAVSLLSHSWPHQPPLCNVAWPSLPKESLSNAESVRFCWCTQIIFLFFLSILPPWMRSKIKSRACAGCFIFKRDWILFAVYESDLLAVSMFCANFGTASVKRRPGVYSLQSDQTHYRCPWWKDQVCKNDHKMEKKKCFPCSLDNDTGQNHGVWSEKRVHIPQITPI